MNGKALPQQRITPQEAYSLFQQYGKTEEMYRVKELYEYYRDNHKPDNDLQWAFLRLLSFVYDTGRVQGIREERAR